MPPSSSDRPATAARHVIVDVAALDRLVRAAVGHAQRTRAVDPELQAAIAGLVTSSRPAQPARPTVTVAQAVAVTGLSESTIRRAIRDGQLPVTRVRGRVLIPTAALVPSRQNRSEPVTPLDMSPAPAMLTDDRATTPTATAGAPDG